MANSILSNVFSLGTDAALSAATGGKSQFPKKKKAGLLNADKALADAAMELLTVSRGTRKGYFDQLTQALQGVIPDARIPDVQNAAEGNLRAGSDARRQTESTLATAGLARTPLGVNTRASQALAANQQVGTTAADFLNSLFLQAPNAVLGQAQTTGLQGLGAVDSIAASQAQNRANANANLVGSLATGAGGLAGTGAYYLNNPPPAPTPISNH